MGPRGTSAMIELVSWLKLNITSVQKLFANTPSLFSRPQIIQLLYCTTAGLKYERVYVKESIKWIRTIQYLCFERYVDRRVFCALQIVCCGTDRNNPGCTYVMEQNSGIKMFSICANINFSCSFHFMLFVLFWQSTNTMKQIRKKRKNKMEEVVLRIWLSLGWQQTPLPYVPRSNRRLAYFMRNESMKELMRWNFFKKNF